jgi:hypothetical protein
MTSEVGPTRRAALYALTGASALAIPAINALAAATPDPVFPAIQRHQAACKAVAVWLPAIDEVAVARKGHEVSQADREAFERTMAFEDQSFLELLATSPTSLAGMRAAIEYMLAFEDGFLSESARPFLATLLKSPLL